MGERIRRLALGLAAALLVARAFWPSELDLSAAAGGGLHWVLALFLVVGLALSGALIGGRLRFRWSFVDLALCALFILVAHSATHAVDRRPAINMAWEWVALGFAYLLVRNLPRTAGESSALASALVATAFAVSVYALYQVRVELPQLQAEFQRNPLPLLRSLNIEPGSHGELIFKNRLLGSTEPWSTFGLPNSLAGFIVGPLVLLLAVGYWNLVKREAEGSRLPALYLAAPIALVLLLCLVLTKSRSAWLGLFCSMCFLAWRARRHVPARVLVTTAVAGLGAALALVGACLATGRLDREVLTQSLLSLGYRWEYWQGTWGVITDGAPDLKSALGTALFSRWRSVFWLGVGPANFGSRYLLHKLPRSSEEILDPHNLFLEVWATAGFWALCALAAALALGLWNLMGPAAQPGAPTGARRLTSRRSKLRRGSALPAAPIREDAGLEDEAPPRRQVWLVAWAGAGWAFAVVVGELNPFQGDLFVRWLILGASWLLAALLAAPLFRRLPVPAPALGAAVLAVLINLLAAGGIGIPTVALALWSMLALGLNLREDRSCSRLHEYDGRAPAFGLAALWAALLGTFLGVTLPFWRCERAMAEAEAAMNHLPPDYKAAEAGYDAAIVADAYQHRPLLGLAYVYWALWQERGSKADDPLWRRIPLLWTDAVHPPRAPSWALHSEHALAMSRLLRSVGPRLTPPEALRYKARIVEATRYATRLHPTSAELHARLAEASAEMSMYQDAINEAALALRLDQELSRHPDKRLPEVLRKRLGAQIPKWTESAARTTSKTTPP